MFNLFKRLHNKLKKRRRVQLYFLLFFMIIASFAEVMSIGAVIPFLAVITNPESIFDYPLIREVIDIDSYLSPKDLILPITIIFICLALIAAALRISVLWLNTRLSFSIGRDLGVEAFTVTLNQPYLVHISTNSSEVISGIATKVYATTATLNLTLSLITSVFLSTCIITLLLYLEPFIALLAGLSIGISYFMISYFFRIKLSKNSKLIDLETTESLKILQEGLGGIREVLMNGTQEIYKETFFQSQLKLRRAQGNNSFLGGSPRFFMEAIGISLIASLAYFSLSNNTSSIDILPLLGAVALGAQKLLPAGQQIFASWAGITGSKDLFESTLNILDQPFEESSDEEVQEIKFNEEIVFDSVCFEYVTGTKILNNFNLTLKKGERLGIVGETGSGKTTFVDILMNLLEIDSGSIKLDGINLNSISIKNFKSLISHVPQSIFLADLSIAENIAFGIDKSKINFEKLMKATEQASLLKFINNCQQGFDTKVGEDGVQLSGGQRQRIGLARALYKQSKILVLDEATSSLDNKTEAEIMTSIENLDKDLTVVIIAHRLSTLKFCDSIAIFHEGQMMEKDTYENLLKNNLYFQQLAKEKKSNI